MRERFRDGASILATYEFHVNHREEEAQERTRNLDHQAVTTGPKFVLQQGESSPEVMRYSGTIFLPSQLAAMTDYFNACDNRTVFFREYTGEEFEVLITRFAPRRVATLRNPRDPTLMHYWTYDLEMEVIP